MTFRGLEDGIFHNFPNQETTPFRDFILLFIGYSRLTMVLVARGYPLVNCYITMGNHHANYGKTHYKWSFSIAMLVITRG